MNPGSLSEAIAAWRDALGADHVIADDAAVQHWRQNVTGLARRVPAVLRPGSTEEVQRVVAIAVAHGCPLYSISGGRNWGFGSRLPVRDDCVVVDLGRMNRIHEVNLEHQYAVVEPGVTQLQLFEYLRDRQLPLVLNVTGSSVHASVIGNALDRGIGYFASRADELSGLEVVLADGRLLKTGFGHYPESRLTHLYRHGHGPFLDGLFSQGNLGIVTRAGVRLLPAPEERVAVICRIGDDARLGRFVDALAGLYRDGVVTTVTHIGNRHRTEIALAPLISAYLDQRDNGNRDSAEGVREFLRAEGYGDWSGITGLQGPRGMVRAALTEVRRALRGIARPMVLTDRRVKRLTRVARTLCWIPWFDRKLAVLPSVAEIQGLAAGVPTSEPMRSLYWAIGATPPAGDAVDPDHGPCGFIYFVPMMPLNGATCREATTLINETFARHRFVPYVTFNLISPQVLEAVINVSFQREQAGETVRAQETLDQLTMAFRERGWLPYRLGVQDMPAWVRRGDTFWDVSEQIKNALDPAGIISPGRYNLR